MTLKELKEKDWTKTVTLNVDDVAIIQTMMKAIEPEAKKANKAAILLLHKIERAEWV